MEIGKIDFIDDIDPNRFIVYANGLIYDTYRKTPVKEYNYVIHESHIVYVALNHRTVSKNWVIGSAFRIKDYEFINGQGINRFFKYNHRNGLSDDFSVNNLNICLKKSDITTDECRMIYECLFDGIKDPYTISKTVGRYVSSSIIERFLKGKNAERLADIFKINYNDLSIIQPNKRSNIHRSLTREEVVEICEALKNYGSPKKASEHIDFATRKQIQMINERKSYIEITKDILPDDIRETSKKFAVPIPENVGNEIWKIVPSHLFPDERILYVSSYGRFVTNIGDELFVKKSTGYAYVDIYGKRDCNVARIVLATFDIDLPHILGVSYDEFKIGFKDSDHLNTHIDNLYWIPYKHGSGGSVKHLTLGKLNTIMTSIKNDPSYYNPSKLRELCLSLEIPYRAACYIANGTTFSHFIYNFNEQNWKPIGIKNYYVSDSGLVRHFDRLVRAEKLPDDERLYVKINNKNRLVSKLVLNSFVGKPNFKPAYPRHKDGDFANDNIANLEWSRVPELTTIKKRKIRYGITHEEYKPLDWIEGIDPTRYTVSNMGRIYDTLKNRYKVSTATSKNRNNHKNKVLIVRIRDINNNIKTYVSAQLVRGTFDESSRNKLSLVDPHTKYVILYKDGDSTNITYNNIGLVHRSHITENAKQIMKKDLSGRVIKQYQSITQCVNDNPGVGSVGLKQHLEDNEPYKGFLWEYV